jgi:hypothetical protein
VEHASGDYLFFLDSDDSTFAYWSLSNDNTSSIRTTSMGYLFGEERDITNVDIKVSVQLSDDRQAQIIKLQSYNGSTWDDEATLLSNTTAGEQIYDSIYALDKTVQGLRLFCSTQRTADIGSEDHTHKYYLMTITFTDTREARIVHNLPTEFQIESTGSLSTVMYDDYETGASTQYKLVDTITPAETSWLNTNQVNTHSAITPDQVHVKLIPKDTSPTAGYPSILGFGFKGWSDLLEEESS